MELNIVAVLGAGTMGHGIAQICAQAGLDVRLYDLKDEFVQAGLDRINNFLKKSIERKKITANESVEVLGRIKGTTQLAEAVQSADLIIEAIPEDMRLKKEFFMGLIGKCKGNSIWASNTSTLSITEMASVTDRPDKFIGLHFFNPVQLMKPIEIIKGILTADETVKAAEALTLKLQKTPILVKDSPGFASTRLGVALFLEASKMLEEGVASIKDIDVGAKLFYGHKMGPFETCDLVGLDARLNNLNSLLESTGNPKWSPPLLLRQLVASSYLGTKPGSKGGYYAYFGIDKEGA
ncbi:MAG: 3-hydroxyacyl-CoA dehydrogenase family protein [Deltaproteobacteria bacterium]|nr:3-hydroxyacyl-CoA dehydrogenase family protein [Deltaproteobacteria bacterium]